MLRFCIFLVVVFLSVILLWVPDLAFWLPVFSLQGDPDFSQTNFALSYFKSFNSVMTFVGIFVNKSYTFSIFGLDCSPVLVLERRQCGFLFRQDSFNDIFINFSLLGHCLHLCVCSVSVIVMYCLVWSFLLSCICVSVTLLEVCLCACLYIC